MVSRMVLAAALAIGAGSAQALPLFEETHFSGDLTLGNPAGLGPSPGLSLPLETINERSVLVLDRSDTVAVPGRAGNGPPWHVRSGGEGDSTFTADSQAVPDSGGTLLMLALALAVISLGRRLKSARAG